MKQYDLIIIGGGAAGLVAAKLARGMNKTVAIIEKTTQLGGECTWTGCIPSKTLIHIAAKVKHAQEAATFYSSTAPYTIDTQKVMAHVRALRQKISATHTPEKLRALGIDIVQGTPTFIDSNTVALGNKKLTAKKFLLATGSRPFIPPIENIEHVPYLTNETLFELPELPRSIIILGGGPIGIEMASALNNLGVTVTIIEMNPHILPKEDRDLVEILSNNLKKQGIKLATSTQAVRAEQLPDGVTITARQHDNTPVTFNAERLLIAVGRKPNREGLGLEALGVMSSPKGITVSTTMQTTVPSIYAAGDVAGPLQFSHMAELQAITAVQNAFIPFFKKKLDYTKTVWVTFSDPELATTGLNEEQARRTYGDHIQIYRTNYSDIDRSKTDEAEVGLCKIICSPRGKVVGATILGARAGEIIHELYIAIYFNKKLSDLYHPIHAYPTYSEVVWQAAKQSYIASINHNIFVRCIKAIYNLFKK